MSILSLTAHRYLITSAKALSCESLWKGYYLLHSYEHRNVDDLDWQSLSVYVYMPRSKSPMNSYGSRYRNGNEWQHPRPLWARRPKLRALKWCKQHHESTKHTSHQNPNNQPRHPQHPSTRESLPHPNRLLIIQTKRRQPQLRWSVLLFSSQLNSLHPLLPSLRPQLTTLKAPSYFSQYFLCQLSQATDPNQAVKTLYIDRDPVTFADIALHLQGYSIAPTNAQHFVRLFADAQFYNRESGHSSIQHLFRRDKMRC